MGEEGAVVPPPAPPRELVRPGPVGGKRDQNRQRRLAQLRDAALPLFIELGIERVTIDEIVRAAGVAKGSFYRYFSDKESLVAFIMAPISAEVGASLDACERALAEATDWPTTVATYQALGFALAPVMLENVEVLRLYLQENRAPAVGARRPVRALTDQIVSRAVALTELAHAQGLLRPEIPPKVSALAVVGAVERLIFEFLEYGPEGLGDPLSVGAALVNLVMDGLRRAEP